MVYSDNDQTDLKNEKEKQVFYVCGERTTDMRVETEDATAIVYEEMIAFIVNKPHFLYRTN